MNLRRGRRPDGRAASAEVRREERGVEAHIQMSRVSARDQLGQDRLQSHVDRTQSARAGAGSNSGTTQLLGNVVEARPGKSLPIVSRYNILPAVDVYVSVQGTDLAAVPSRSAPEARRTSPANFSF